MASAITAIPVTEELAQYIESETKVDAELLQGPDSITGTKSFDQQLAEERQEKQQEVADRANAGMPPESI